MEKLRLVRLLGDGAFANVYAARRGRSRRWLAVKRQVKAGLMISREVETMKLLKHPCIVPLEEAFVTQTDNIHTINGARRTPLFLNIVMPAYDCTLQTLIDMNQTGIPLAFVKGVAYQILLALAHAHGNGIAHRDIKPNNIFMNPRTREAVLGDWGSAASISSAPAATRQFQSPEQLLGVTHSADQSDIWALGVILYYSLTGKQLTAGEDDWECFCLTVAKCGSVTPDLFTHVGGEISGMSDSVVSLLTETSHNITPLREEAKDWGPFGLLLCAMLRVSPCARVSAEEALQHHCFQEERDGKGHIPQTLAGPLDTFYRPLKWEGIHRSK